MNRLKNAQRAIREDRAGHFASSSSTYPQKMWISRRACFAVDPVVDAENKLLFGEALWRPYGNSFGTQVGRLISELRVAGQLHELDHAMAASVAAAVRDLPFPLSVNLSPSSVARLGSGILLDLLLPVLDSVFVEITECCARECYGDRNLREFATTFQNAGGRLVLDDVGDGAFEDIAWAVSGKMGWVPSLLKTSIHHVSAVSTISDIPIVAEWVRTDEDREKALANGATFLQGDFPRSLSFAE